jgi:hypothetical protein
MFTSYLHIYVCTKEMYWDILEYQVYMNVFGVENLASFYVCIYAI